MGHSNMPAKNKGAASVPQGTRHGASSIAGGSASGADPKGGKGKPNMPAHNTPNRKPSLGTTKHGAGEVPGYLK